jgi:hypothetical protein
MVLETMPKGFSGLGGRGIRGGIMVSLPPGRAA